MGTALGGTGESVMIDRKNLSQLKDKLQQAIKQNPKFDKIKNNVEMTVTGEGLRIELLENAGGTFFDSGQAKPTETAIKLLDELAQELGHMPNSLLIEGHTDSKPYSGNGEYSNWELSADRANAARKVMQEGGLRDNQVAQIRGYADQQLRLPNKPEDPTNRRISIIVRYTEGDLPLSKEDKADQEKEAKEAKAGKGGAKAGAEKPTDAAKPPATQPQTAQPLPAKPEAAKPPAAAAAPPPKTAAH
jgi:chemotaxis protein MotB